MTLLETISGPRDLKELGPDELPRLAGEIRDLLIQTVSKTGGHLGPNLGVVELTIALHRVFDSPRDTILFDTGHQAYVHKLLTGRQATSPRCGSTGGLSGYPSRAESEHDVIENSHASTALCYADGLAKAYQLRGETHRRVVAVIGDGALTGGMAWEALNNIAGARPPAWSSSSTTTGAPTRRRSAAWPTTSPRCGATSGYEHVLDWVKTTLTRTPVVGPPLYETLHGDQEGPQGRRRPAGLFEDLGLKYVGPIDGHDIRPLEHALRRARDFGGPVIVHVHHPEGARLPAGRATTRPTSSTRVGVIDPAPGGRWRRAGATWTPRLRRRDGRDRRAAARTSSPSPPRCSHPVGLERFAEALPGPGLRRRHRRAARRDLRRRPGHRRPAPGRRGLRDLPQPGLRPGADGRGPAQAAGDLRARPGRRHRRRTAPATTACGTCRSCRSCPGLRLAAPRDADQPARAAARGRRGRRRPDRACASRRARVGADVPAVDRLGGMDVLPGRPRARPRRAAGRGRRAGRDLPGGGRTGWPTRASASPSSTRAGSSRWTRRWPRWPPRTGWSSTVEDNGRVGGVGAPSRQALRDAGVDTPLRDFGIPQQFLDHGRARPRSWRAGPDPAAPGPGHHRGRGRAVPRSLPRSHA